jgi:hypothetical protein
MTSRFDAHVSFSFLKGSCIYICSVPLVGGQTDESRAVSQQETRERGRTRDRGDSAFEFDSVDGEAKSHCKDV